MLKTGDVIKGKITGIQSYGLFVENEELTFKGLIHISECSDDYIGDLNSIYKIGQVISCLVVDIDPANQHVSLSIKALHQKAGVHQKPVPAGAHAYHKFYWTNNEDVVGFQSIAAKMTTWKKNAKQTYGIR
ncbi:S1 RNA-binding domain-containing protein [Pediococcus siamensis]|uniref:S1 RNA-binding domain-containing protein n=1 Tax=Pediococcus siamensis TaxID=381829 RepID=UPI00399F7ADC